MPVEQVFATHADQVNQAMLGFTGTLRPGSPFI
jgi:hypothetical protein